MASYRGSDHRDVHLSHISKHTRLHFRGRGGWLDGRSFGCFFSSLAAILVEAALKLRPYNPTEHADVARNMWLRNCQLSLAGTAVSLAIVGLRDWKQAIEHGLFQGYGPLVWLIIVLRSMVGIMVSFVITYADNILKSFATSLSVLLSTAASAMMLDFKVTAFFAAGASLVLLATFQYHADFSP